MRSNPALEASLPYPWPYPPSRARALAVRLANALWTRRARPPRPPLALALLDGEVAGFRVGRGGLVVRCLEGCLWVTHDAAPADHVLAPGERLVARGRGHLVVYALAPSRATVTSGRDESGARPQGLTAAANRAGIGTSKWSPAR